MEDCGFWDQPFQEEVGSIDYCQDSFGEDLDLFSSAFGPSAHFFAESPSDSHLMDWLADPSVPLAVPLAVPEREEVVKCKKCEFCRKRTPATTSFGCPRSTVLHHAHAACMMAKSRESADCIFPHDTKGPLLFIC